MRAVFKPLERKSRSVDEAHLHWRIMCKPLVLPALVCRVNDDQKRPEFEFFEL